MKAASGMECYRWHYQGTFVHSHSLRSPSCDTQESSQKEILQKIILAALWLKMMMKLLFIKKRSASHNSNKLNDRYFKYFARCCESYRNEENKKLQEKLLICAKVLFTAWSVIDGINWRHSRDFKILLRTINKAVRGPGECLASFELCVRALDKRRKFLSDIKRHYANVRCGEDEKYLCLWLIGNSGAASSTLYQTQSTI